MICCRRRPFLAENAVSNIGDCPLKKRALVSRNGSRGTFHVRGSIPSMSSKADLVVKGPGAFSVHGKSAMGAAAI